MKATPEDVAKPTEIKALRKIDLAGLNEGHARRRGEAVDGVEGGFSGLTAASMKATPEDVAKPVIKQVGSALLDFGPQ